MISYLSVYRNIYINPWRLKYYPLYIFLPRMQFISKAKATEIFCPSSYLLWNFSEHWLALLSKYAFLPFGRRENLPHTSYCPSSQKIWICKIQWGGFEEDLNHTGVFSMSFVSLVKQILVITLFSFFLQAHSPN